MKRDYIFEKSNILPFFYDSKIDLIVKLNKSSLLTASNFILDLLESKSFYLQLLEYENRKTTTKITFLAQNKDKKLKFSLEGDILTINWQNNTFVYKLDFIVNKLYAKLISYETRYPNKTIKQSIQMHVLILEVILNDKKYLLNLPFDVSYFIDSSYFRLINQDTDIFDLKKIYKDYFYLNQTEYEKSIASSVAIFKIVKGNEIPLDELFLIQGQIEKYLLTTEIKGVRITLSGTKKEDDTITIHNYHTPKNIGLEEAIIALYQKKEQLLEQNRDEYYKRIRNIVIK